MKKYSEVLAGKEKELARKGYSASYIGTLKSIVRSLEEAPVLERIVLRPADIYEAQEQGAKAGAVVDGYIDELKRRLVAAAWLSYREDIHGQYIPHVGTTDSSDGMKTARYLERLARRARSGAKRRVLAAEARRMEILADMIATKHEGTYISPPL